MDRERGQLIQKAGRKVVDNQDIHAVNLHIFAQSRGVWKLCRIDYIYFPFLFGVFMASPKLLLLLFLTFSLSACLSEEEKAIQVRMDKLDAELSAASSQLDRFFQGLETLQQQISPSGPEMDTTRLSPEDRSVLKEMEERYRFMRPAIATLQSLEIQPWTNAVGLWLNPEADPHRARNMIQYLKYVDQQLVHRIMDRREGEEWYLNISDPDEFSSEERRDADAGEIADQIQALGAVRYLLGVEEKFVVGPKMIGENKFESGLLLAKIHVFDLVQQKIIQEVYTLNRNSMVNFTFTEKQDSQEQELMRALRDELFVTLQQRLKN